MARDERSAVSVEAGPERTAASLQAEIDDLRRRLEVAEDTIQAIGNGEVDAFVISSREHEQVYTLETADRPYRLLVEGMVQGAAILDGEGVLLFANPSFGGMLGREPRDLLGVPIGRLLDAPSLRTLENLLALGAGEPRRAQVVFHRADGTPVPALITANRRLDDSSLTCLIVSDLTEQRYYERLAEAEHSLRLALEAAVAIAFSWEVPENIVRRPYSRNSALAPTSAEHTGTIEEVIAAIHPDDRGRFMAGVEAALSNQGDYRNEYRVMQPDGSVRWLSERGRVEFDASGRPLRLSGLSMDVTERKEAEERALASERRERARAAELEAVMQATPAAIWIASDPECRRISGNAASYRLVGMPAGANVSASAPDVELPLRTFREYRDDVPLTPEELPMQVAASTGRDVRGAELTMRFDDGTERHLFGNAAPLREADGSVRGAISAFIDITELKQTQKSLKDADRRKDEFLAMLAHELRNPLAAVRSATELLRRGGVDEESLHWGLEVVERQVRHLSRLIDDLLDISRITRGVIPLRKEPCDACVTIQRACEGVRELIHSKGHRLTVSLPPEPLPIEADPTRLEQVVCNLLANAAKYTDQGGHIRIEAAREADHVTVRVTDTGIGIPTEMLPRIFDLFTQVDATLDRAQGGLGIGLTLVRSLVEMHGGTVSAASRGVGQGSEFTIRLPATHATPGADVPQAPGDRARSRTLRVLIVDDSVDTAIGMSRLLKRLKHEVRVAHDGPTALEIAGAFRPEVVLLDIGLPGMNGYDLAQALRTDLNLSDARLIAISGYGQEQDRLRSRATGIDHHLLKPVNIDEILTLFPDASRAPDADQPAS